MGKEKSYSSLTKSTFNFPFWIFTKMEFFSLSLPFSLCVYRKQPLEGIFTKQNYLFPMAPWKRNSPKGRELTKIIFLQKRTTLDLPIFLFLNPAVRSRELATCREHKTGLQLVAGMVSGSGKAPAVR